MSASRETLLAALVAAAILLPGLGSFTLVDPWEGHYAEVGRRILQDDDWIVLRWQDEVFRSKPALTPWLIAASLRAHGLAKGGGYSGEMATSPAVVWAVRLPFALCGVLGMLAVWLALRRLASRRAAWLGLLTLGATPFYALVARQAMTDMPMVMAATGAIAALVLALHDGDAPLRRWRGLTAAHVVLAIIALVVIGQVAYNTASFVADPRIGRGIRAPQPHLWLSIPFALGLGALGALTCAVRPLRTRRDAYLLAGYALIGVSLLAKGPPGAALVAVTGTLFLCATTPWRQLARTVWQLRPLEGALVIALIALPWHAAMMLRDGQPFITEYIGHHWLKRAADGVHEVNRKGEGTLGYFVQQLGIGLWPLLALVPGALLAAFAPRDRTAREHLRTLALLWAVAGFALFTVVETKFHHYVLPAVPGFAILVALWLDDLLAGRAYHRGAVALGIAAVAFVAWDVATEQARFIELFCYRYDRPWPSMAPWHIDLSVELYAFAVAFIAAAIGLCLPRARRIAAIAAIACALCFGQWVTQRYMRAAGPHWGQGPLHRTYYQQRHITGVTLRGPGARIIAADTVIPRTLRIGAALRVVDRDGTVHAGTAFALFDHRLWIHVPTLPPRSVTPRPLIDADPMIAFNLFWRAELFWSGGELWGPTPARRTTFRYNDTAAFGQYIARPDAAGRRYFAITEAAQVPNLRRQLPAAARPTLKILSHSSNKFTLVTFELPSSDAP